jgi:putative membrane protein
VKNLLIRWVVLVVSLAAAAWLTSLVLPGQFIIDTSVKGVMLCFVGVAVLSLLNATLGKVLKFLTVPLSCLTLGLFSLVVNAATFFVAGNLNLGFQVKGFIAALLGSLLFSAVNGVLGGVLLKDRDHGRDED